jgi:hypothetical protein
MNSGRAAQCLHWLQREFPLEARVASLPAHLLRVYHSILESWSKGVPPSIGIADAAVLRDLAGFDAILIEEVGISCYPFSACDTGIRVAVGQKSVNAMCAIDALAIPGIMAGVAQLEANCAVCGTRFACVVDQEGVIGSGGDHVAVAWGDKPAGSSCCGRSLCPQIRFQCVGCPAPTEGHLLDIADGAAVGIAFFSFQRRLLQTSGASGGVRRASP